MTEPSVAVGGGREATMRIGPLGSTIHVLRADARTIAALASIDWNRRFRRVCLDPVSGLIVLMAPSRLHEELAMALDHVVDVAASSLAGAVKALRTTRLSEPGAPPGTGMEPDGAFYVGDNARAYREALAKGEDAADAFFEKTAPDVVVEVELTDVEAQKIDRYGDLGVQELWLLRRRRDEQIPEAEFLALRPPPKPRCLTASNLVGGLTPADVREAVSGARLSLTRDERTQAIAHVVRRRRHSRVRICEDSAS